VRGTTASHCPAFVAIRGRARHTDPRHLLTFPQAPGQDHAYLLGTEEGSLHRCSKAFASQYLDTYTPGHSMAVYAVRWNALHPRLFLSAGADWAVKLWDSSRPEGPLLTWDLGAPVGDIAWAPYSSTVFAAVSVGCVGLRTGRSAD